MESSISFSFLKKICGKTRDEVDLLISGQEGHICDNCVQSAMDIVEQEVETKIPVSKPFNLNVKKT